MRITVRNAHLRSTAARGHRDALDGLLLLFILSLATSGARATASSIPNPGFETGDLAPWMMSCLGQDGGCANVSISVGPAYARTGRYGARLFIAQEGGWGQAQIISPWFTDSSATYTIPMKLIGGATKFYSGVLVSIYDSNGGVVRYRGNALGSVDAFPHAEPNFCSLYHLIPGNWVDYTFDFQGDYFRKYGQMPGTTRFILISAYQDDDYAELYVDDLQGSSSQSAPITVTGLTLNHDAVSSCDTVTGKVTLSAPAPPGGAVVTITSTNRAAPAPLPLTIPAGATSASFPLDTAVATTAHSGTLTAVYARSSKSASLTVRPAGVTAVTLSSNVVLGSKTVTGTVALGCPAAPERIDITLLSPNPAVAAIPAQVSIRPGDSTAAFTITTTPVAATAYIRLTAASGAGVATVVLQVLPPELLSLTLNPAGLTGGAPTTGEVHLSGPAPTEGILVLLSSDNDQAVTLPKSITVPAGASSACFPVTTQTVTTETYVTLSADYGGRTRMATLVLSPSIP